MRNTMLIPHTLIATIVITLFLFQIAMLMASVSVCSRESVMATLMRTYMRRTINSEEAARARYDKIWKKRDRNSMTALPLERGSIG